MTPTIKYQGDVEQRLDRIEGKVDTMFEKHADLRVAVERKSQFWGAVSGLAAVIFARVFGVDR